MSSFDPVFLHGVMDYTCGARPSPDIPDWKHLQKQLGEVQHLAETEWQNNDGIANDIKSIASDIDFDNELE